MVTDYLQHNSNGNSQTDPELDAFNNFGNGEIVKPRKIHYEVISTMKGIHACLRIRYLTYRYVNFIEENKDRYDIDPYDEYSTFLGAFDVTTNKKVLIGTLRIISGDKKSKISPIIQDLIKNARDPQIKAMGERPEIFPIMESFTLPDSYLENIKKDKPDTIDNCKFHPYELSRLAIRPDYWMYNVDVGLHHLFILESRYIENPRNDFLIAIHPRSRKRYERIGFKIVPGTEEVLYKHIDQLAIAMVLDLEQYLKRPRSYLKACEALLPQYKKCGYFTRLIERRKNKRD